MGGEFMTEIPGMPPAPSDWRRRAAFQCGDWVRGNLPLNRRAEGRVHRRYLYPAYGFLWQVCYGVMWADGGTGGPYTDHELCLLRRGPDA